MTGKIRVYLDTSMNVFMLANKEKIEFVTPFITKAEVVREPVSGYESSYEEKIAVWNKFIKSLGCKYVEKSAFDSRKEASA